MNPSDIFLVIYYGTYYVDVFENDYVNFFLKGVKTDRINSKTSVHFLTYERYCIITKLIIVFGTDQPIGYFLGYTLWYLVCGCPRERLFWIFFEKELKLTE